MLKSHASIDLAKFIGAILIVAIHTSLFQEIPVLGFLNLHYFTSFAVPFYFVASGYFLFGRMKWETNGSLEKCAENRKKLWKYEKRLITLYCIWSVVFLLWTIPYWYSIDWWGFHAVKDYIVSLFLSGSLYHFWYILASIYGAVACYFVCRYLHGKIRIVVFSLAWTLYLLTYSYSWIKIPILSDLLSLTGKLDNIQTGILCAMPLMAIGGYIGYCEKEESAKRRSMKLVLFAMLLLAEILIVNRFTVNKTNHSYMLFTIPVAYYLFQWILYDWNIPGIFVHKSQYLRLLSVDIYCCHAFLLNFLNLILKEPNSFVRFVILLTCSLLFSIIIEWFKKHIIAPQENHQLQSHR